MEKTQKLIYHSKCKKVIKKSICNGDLQMFDVQDLWTPRIAAYKRVSVLKCNKCNYVIREDEKEN